ncbi:hypothetical protein F2Q69_00049649 [Brassica cretica]|uniref:Uncharacterized protein n=1 Tax=Brassica cretica TaxID=69181 RepID=A0A8S9PM99_BRACR|nr:hypothetical protein F2Q69_00049649 [Brassica cretica]
MGGVTSSIAVKVALRPYQLTYKAIRDNTYGGLMLELSIELTIQLCGPNYQENVNIRLGDGSMRRGQVMEVDAVVQFLKKTSEIGTVQFTEVLKTHVSQEMFGRILNGSRKPIDYGPPILYEACLDVSGINLRGDINVCAKSSFLRKSSSAAGLTATVAKELETDCNSRSHGAATISNLFLCVDLSTSHA